MQISKLWWNDCYKILHMPQQHWCCGMCRNCSNQIIIWRITKKIYSTCLICWWKSPVKWAPGISNRNLPLVYVVEEGALGQWGEVWGGCNWHNTPTYPMQKWGKGPPSLQPLFMIGWTSQVWWAWIQMTHRGVRSHLFLNPLLAELFLVNISKH